MFAAVHLGMEQAAGPAAQGNGLSLCLKFLNPRRC
jgi:hypothetical protein